MYRVFGLTLLLNHACNLRCSYCYAGRKFSRKLPLPFGRKALQRAIHSIQPGGRLELGFFGGEPLLEPALLTQLYLDAQTLCRSVGVDLSTALTTNGTVTSGRALQILMDPGIKLTISLDGPPEIHDLHRCFEDGRGSSSLVQATLGRLIAAGRDLDVAAVVRPDTVSRFPDVIRYAHAMGVRMVVPTLDLWACWAPDDLRRLESALSAAADIWLEHLPTFGVSWFNEKLVEQTGLKTNPTARCGFGTGEVTVTPSGNLYPCERLVGEDRTDHPLRMPGHVCDQDDFLDLQRPGSQDVTEPCGLSCRCSNFVRTGCTTRPDALLKQLDGVCDREVRKRIARHASVPVNSC